jgi:aquaporin Z
VTFYSLAQFVGGWAGFWYGRCGGQFTFSSAQLRRNDSGPNGPWVAFIAEAAISFLLVFIVLILPISPSGAFTGVVAGICVATFITFESPLSGMSMNPARTLGSALLPHLWQCLWIYFTAPPLGMLLAAEVYVLLKTRVAARSFIIRTTFDAFFANTKLRGAHIVTSTNQFKPARPCLKKAID